MVLTAPPSRTAAPVAPAAGAARSPRRLLPVGAAKWATLYVGHDGRPETSQFPVPVDENDRRTDHIRVQCFGVPGCDRDAWIMPGDKAEFCPVHGALMAAAKAEKPPVLPWSDLWEAAEKPLRPFWILAAEAAAGIGMHTTGLPAVDGLLLGGTATVGAYVGTRRYLSRRAIKHEHIEKGQTTGRHVATIQRRARTAAYIGTTATAWLTAATSADPSTPLGRLVWASLPVAWALSAAPWWRYLEADRNRPEPVVIAPVFDVDFDDLEPDENALAAAEAGKTWTEDVGFANTELDLSTWKRTVAGWQAEVVATKKGALVALVDAERMKSTIGKIAAGYDVNRSAITWIGEHGEGSNRALLLVQPNNPLKVPQLWEGPDSIDMENGVAISGRTIDGKPMYEVLYRKRWGAPNRVTLGGTGGGKSERVRKRLLIERWAHFTDPVTDEKRGAFLSFLHDPKDMDSYGEFTAALPAYGTTRDEAHMIADALIREMDRRFAFKRTIKWKDRRGRERFGSLPWNPAVHGPIISSFWDEFHELAGDKAFVDKLTKLARKQRACGMTFEMLSHGGTIGDTGSQVLRDLAGGITTLFKTKNALNMALVAGGVEVGDPRTLPGEPGMCFVVDGSTQSSMMARGSWVPGEEDVESDDELTLYDYLFDADNRPIGYQNEIPPETAEAFGKEFMEWAEAGRKPGGRDAKASPSAAFLRPVPSGVPANATAETVMRHILLDAPQPMSRGEITADPRWTFGVSTMTNVFRAGQDASPPWLIRHPEGKGTFELTAAAREELTAAADEEREDQAA